MPVPAELSKPPSAPACNNCGLSFSRGCARPLVIPPAMGGALLRAQHSPVFIPTGPFESQPGTFLDKELDKSVFFSDAQTTVAELLWLGPVAPAGLRERPGDCRNGDARMMQEQVREHEY